jgi:hypothetical protein
MLAKYIFSDGGSVIDHRPKTKRSGCVLLFNGKRHFAGVFGHR